MPLTAKGEKIESAMKKEYGGKKGESVFYASRNSGRISGVDADTNPYDKTSDKYRSWSSGYKAGKAGNPRSNPQSGGKAAAWYRGYDEGMKDRMKTDSATKSLEEKKVESWVILNWPKKMILEELKKQFSIGEIEGIALIKMAKQKLETRKDSATKSLDELIAGASAVADRARAAIDADKPNDKDKQDDADAKKESLANFERELGRAMGKALKDLDANDREMITNWLKGGISPAHAMERYSGHVKEKSVGSEAATDAEGKKWPDNLSTDELRRLLTQLQKDLDSDDYSISKKAAAREIEKVKKTLKSRTDADNPHLKDLLGQLRAMIVKFGASEAGKRGEKEPENMKKLREQIAKERGDSALSKAQAAFARGDIDEGALATFQRLAQTGGPDDLGLKYPVQGKSRALTATDAKKPGYDTSTAEGQKRLMRESVGQEYKGRQTIDLKSKKDYGADPLGNGKFKMVPSGDVVDFEERNRRLARKDSASAKKEGAAAKASGKALSASPYAVGTQDWKDWFDGWQGRAASAKKEGAAAKASGKALSASPYAVGTQDWKDWFDGWQGRADRVFKVDSAMVRDRVDKLAEGLHSLLKRTEAIGRGDAGAWTYDKVSKLTFNQVKKEIEKELKIGSKLNDKMIAEGRGNERPSETRTKNDPLARQLIEHFDRLAPLVDWERRMSGSSR